MDGTWLSYMCVRKMMIFAFVLSSTQLLIFSFSGISCWTHTTNALSKRQAKNNKRIRNKKKNKKKVLIALFTFFFLLNFFIHIYISLCIRQSHNSYHLSGMKNFKTKRILQFKLQAINATLKAYENEYRVERIHHHHIFFSFEVSCKN